MNLDIVNPKINEYLDRLLPRRDPWFMEMEAKAAVEDFPAIGPQVGVLLEMLARSIKATRIMELGSGFGYSGLWFARALPENGYVLLTDFEEDNRELAEKYFEQAGKRHLMEFKTGDALKLLSEEKGPYDIIFNDIDKEFYPKVIEPVYRLLRPGGLFITDNTLWEGKVIQEPPEEIDELTAAVKDFNQRLKSRGGFLTTWLPLRDGISVSMKMEDGS
jgi:predicted O-methyltransferase YrrM